MNLASMLNDGPRQVEMPTTFMNEEKRAILNLSATLHLLAAKDRKCVPVIPAVPVAPVPVSASTTPAPVLALTPLPPPSTPTSIPTYQNPNHTRLRLGPQVKSDPGLWKPKLSFAKVLGQKQNGLSNGVSTVATGISSGNSNNTNVNNYTSNNNSYNSINGNSNAGVVQLITQDVCDRDNEPKLLLEDNYEIQGSYSRGLFVQMSKNGIQHTFVFPYPDHPWFKDMHGLRKSAYINLRTEEGELWELHLKASGDKRWLFGYLCRPDDIIRIVRESTRELLQQRKLPLVLDLDDTLVRLVGEGDRRHVPERDLHLYGDRVSLMSDGRKIVLTERVKEFLEWASTLFEISICSLGDQQYVENVVSVIDPQRRYVHGILYSARSEYDYIQRSTEQSRPPKNLLALYAFCELKDQSLGSGFTLPITIDDEERMWPAEQRENIIMVKKHLGSECWSVTLDTVVKKVLNHIHTEFFRQLDIWQTKQAEAERLGRMYTRDPPSALAIYKGYLRDMMGDLIAQS
ncbi:hypothetical protein F4703DRAFT_1933257 [Phycomyces blakesleeanus]